MRNIRSKYASGLASTIIAMAMLVPAVGAAQAAPIWNYGTVDSPGCNTRYVGSSFDDTERKHGSTAVGDIGGTNKSPCLLPNKRAYSESIYSPSGGFHHAYYRYSQLILCQLGVAELRFPAPAQEHI